MADIKDALIAGAPRLAISYAGEGELLVLLHGIGGNRTNWARNMEGLAKRFTVVAIDARGWGDSDDYEGPLSFWDMADDINRIADHFGSNGVHLMGLSMGGRTAMTYAERHPARLRSLVLCDTLRGQSSWSEEEKAEFIRSRQEPLLNGLEPADIAAPVARSLLSEGAGEEAFRTLVDSISRLHKESYIKAVDETVNFPPHQRLGDIAVPTLVIVGAEDKLTPPDEARAIAAEIPDAELVIVPQAGHLVNIEAPEHFNAEVTRFYIWHSLGRSPSKL